MKHTYKIILQIILWIGIYPLTGYSQEEIPWQKVVDQLLEKSPDIIFLGEEHSPDLYEILS